MPGTAAFPARPVRLGRDFALVRWEPRLGELDLTCPTGLGRAVTLSFIGVTALRLSGHLNDVGRIRRRSADPADYLPGQAWGDAHQTFAKAFELHGAPGLLGVVVAVRLAVVWHDHSGGEARIVLDDLLARNSTKLAYRSDLDSQDDIYIPPADAP